MNQKRELFDGLIRIHVLLHARQEPIFGLAMMKELSRHGYRIGPGTLYPLLHGLERADLLKAVHGQEMCIRDRARPAHGRVRTSSIPLPPSPG